MRYLFVGDTHGSIDLGKLQTTAFKELDLNWQDVLIQCGDFGAPWNAEDDEALSFWRALETNVVVCLGNHENYAWIRKQPIIKRYGAWGYQILPNVFAPLIGEIARIGNKRFWFYSGGYSVDFAYRKLGVSIFAEELENKEQSDKAIGRLLRSRGVDFVISHDGPRRFIVEHWGYPIQPPKPAYLMMMKRQASEAEHAGFALDQVYAFPKKWKYWFFGHHHKDYAFGNLRCLYRQMVLLEGEVFRVIE